MLYKGQIPHKTLVDTIEHEYPTAIQHLQNAITNLAKHNTIYLLETDLYHDLLKPELHFKEGPYAYYLKNYKKSYTPITAKLHSYPDIPRTSHDHEALLLPHSENPIHYKGYIRGKHYHDTYHNDNAVPSLEVITLLHHLRWTTDYFTENVSIEEA